MRAGRRVGLVESNGWWSAFTAISDRLAVPGLLSVFCYCCTARRPNSIVGSDCRSLLDNLNVFTFVYRLRIFLRLFFI